MPTIRPVSDLKTNLEEIARDAHFTEEPVYLTENGYGSLVILSMEAWEEFQFKRTIEPELRESARQVLSPDCKYMTEDEVYGPIEKMIDDYEAAQKKPPTKKIVGSLSNA